MRPLAVLILVLGALAALFFALFSGEERRPPQNESQAIVPQPQTLVDEELQVQLNPIPSTPTTASLGGRTSAGGSAAVPTDPSSSFSGFITGQIIDTNGFAVPGAMIKLIQIPASALIIEGDLLLLGEERAKDPIAVVKSLPNGDFAIDGIQPSERWGLVVSHANYSSTTVGPLNVPLNGGLPRQLVRLVPGNTLFGRVTAKGSGVAIPGATLVLSTPMAAFRQAGNRGAGSNEVTTDERGAYSFANTSRSVKTLIIRAPGHATAILNNFTAVLPPKVELGPVVIRGRVKPPEILEPEYTEVVSRQFDIQLESSMSIAGQVLSPDGVGVKGAAIQAYCLTQEVGSHGQTVSLAGGEFLISDLGPGQYSISVVVSGYQCLPIQRVDAGTTDLQIDLLAQGSVAGRAINDATGRALHKFKCTVRTLYPDNLAAGQAIKTKNFSDSRSGSFRVDGLSAGDYVIEIKARGLASSFSSPFSVQQGEATGDIVVRVTEGGTLRGSVIDARTGKPVAGARVSTEENNHIDSPLLIALGNSGQSASTLSQVSTAEDGTFEIKLMTPATYQIKIEKAGFSAIIRNGIKVGDGQVTPLEAIRLAAGSLIEGHVRDLDGSPIAGARVMLAPKDKSNHWAARNQRTDSDGHYVMRNVASGEYELSASRPLKPGAGFLDSVLDMKKSTIILNLIEGTNNVYDLDFAPKKP